MKKNIGSIITTVIILLICTALCVAIIYKMFQADEGVDFGMMPMSVENNESVNVYTQTIEPTTFVKSIKFYATVEDDGDVVDTLASTSGYVTEILVSEGDSVNEGDVVGYIDPSTAGSTYKKSSIVAKVSGVIDSISAVVGDYLNSGSTFATIKTDSDYSIVLDLPEKYIDSVKIGSVATVTSTVRENLDATATVSYMAKSIDTTKRTVEIELTTDDTEYLLDGLVVTANLEIKRLDDVIVIPTDAISSVGSKMYVYIVEDGKAKQVEVTVSDQNDSESVISSGLNVGDVVIVEGSVSDAAEVNIVER